MVGFMGLSDLFKKKENPMDAHSLRVFTLAAQAGQSTRNLFQREGQELGPTAWVGVVMEFHNLYIQLTDRALFGRIPEAKRNDWMEKFTMLTLDTGVSTICKGWGDERIRKIQQECRKNYGISLMQDYGQCAALYPKEGEPLKGTMIWEFSQTMAAIIGHEHDAAYVTFFTTLIDFDGLELERLVAAVTRL